MIKKLKQYVMVVKMLIRTMSAPSEARSAWNGFLSWKAEVHAVAAGFGIGFAAIAHGEVQAVGLVVTAVSMGLRGRSADKYSRVFLDIVREPHYAIAALALGSMFGVFVGSPLYLLGLSVALLSLFSAAVVFSGLSRADL